MKKNIKRYLYFFLGELIIIGFISLLSLTGLLTFNTSKIIMFIFNTIYFILLGYHIRKKTSGNKYLNELKYGSVIILINIILSLIFRFKLNVIIINLIYYSLMFLGSLIPLKKGTNH